MSCKEFEKKIWLLDELSPNEKFMVEAHLSNCDLCKTIFENAQDLSRMVTESKNRLPVPQNAAALTHHVMTSIPQKRLQILEFGFNANWWRYAIRTASISLIIFFSFENINHPVQAMKKYSATNTVTLNSMHFLKSYQMIRMAPRISSYAKYQKIKESHYQTN